MSLMSDQKTCKVVLLGESGVGKTSIISRYITGTFNKNCESTNGASYSSKTIKLPKIKKELKMDIWDTAGQEKYRSLTKFFYKDASIAIFVFDVTRRESYEEIKNYWINQLKTFGEGNIIIGIAGNKSDLIEEEAVKEDEVREYAIQIGAIFRNTSAYSNVGVDELFEELGMRFVEPDYQDIIENQRNSKIGNIVLDKNAVKKGNNNIKGRKKGCC